MQSGNTLFNGRVGREQLANATGNAHGGHALGQLTGHHATQTGQRIHHRLLAPHQLGSAGIRTEFALAAEPGHDDGSHKAQQDIEHDGGDVITNAGARALGILVQETVYRVTNDTAQEHHEGIHHALDQRHGHHVAIGDVGHFVANDGFHLFAGHALQQAGTNGHQCRVFERTRSERIGSAFKNADFGHADLGFVRKFAHSLHNPGFIGIGGLVNHPHTRRPLGHRLADQQRNDGATKTHDQ